MMHLASTAARHIRFIAGRLAPAAALVAALAGCAPARTGSGGDAPHYLFAYFTGNGEDGLHLAHSRDGFTWTALRGGRSFLAPEVGTERLMRDPSIVRGADGTFHMVWTAGWHERGIGYATSRDLIHWSPQRFLPVMEHEPGARNTWAPELFHDPERGEFLILWASTIPGRFPATDGQDARGADPGWNHRIYYTATRDFQTFSPTRLLYERGFNVIDAALVRAGERYVMFLKDETNLPFAPQKNIRVAFADDPHGPFGAPSDPVTGPYWAEGPAPLRVGSRWHVYFDRYIDHRYGVVTSDDLRSWTDQSDRLRVPEGMRHGTALEVPAEVARAILEAG